MSANSRKQYTVKEVAKLSSVSVRTLRFYDEIGLLKPAFYGDNGYRYYEKEQLLTLQQILFYRELGFELSMIQQIMTNPRFDKVSVLRSHREHLLKETERTKDLIRTIDKTLAHIEEEVPMSDTEMYLGFDPKKQAQYEQEAIERWGDPAREKIEESKRRTKNWRKEDYEKVKNDYDAIHRALVGAIDRNVPPKETGVQALIKQHYAVVDRFWTPNKESYVGLGKMYCEHPEFRKMYDSYHPQLAAYLAEAMKVFADKNL